MRLFVLLAVVPIIEIALFIEVGGWLGTWPTIGIVVLTALVGSMLLRQQGLAVLSNVQDRLRRGEDPGRLLAEGAMILIAGVLLLTPGFFTDAVGLSLLIPQVRAAVWSYAARHVHVVRAQNGHSDSGHEGPARDQTIDGSWTEADAGSDAQDRPRR